jgi:hypothetical protein
MQKVYLKSRKTFEGIDRFAAPVSLNFQGQFKFSSLLGSFCSLILYAILISYGWRKFQIFS